MLAPRSGKRWVSVPPQVWVEDVAVSHLEVADDWSTGDGFPFVNRAISRDNGVVREWDIVKMPRMVKVPETPVQVVKVAKQASASETASTGTTPASEGSASLGIVEMRELAHRVRPKMMESIRNETGGWESEEMGCPVEEGRYETNTFPQQEKWWNIRFEPGIKAGYALAHDAEVLEFLGIAKGRLAPMEDEENLPPKVATGEGVMAQKVQSGVTLAFRQLVWCLCGLRQSLNHIHQCRRVKMHYAFHRGIIMRYDEVQQATSDLFVEALFPRPQVREIPIPPELLGYFLLMKKDGAGPTVAPNVGPKLDVWAEDVISEMENRFYQGVIMEFATMEGARLADRATGGTFMQESFVAAGEEDYPRTLDAARDDVSRVLHLFATS